jgi:DNA invertase Pin-like site-specific DNA recombinase
MKTYVYLRVSTKDQSTDRQQEAIKEYIKKHNIKVTATFEDKQSGKDFNRQQYEALKAVVKSEDTVIIKELDRLGRNYNEIKEELREFKNRGIKIVILDLPMLDGINDELLYQVIQDIIINIMGYVAQKEREKIQSRVIEGLNVAKEKGVRLGRPERTFPDNFKKYYEKWKAEEITAVEFSKLMGMGRTTLYRYINQWEQEGE